MKIKDLVAQGYTELEAEEILKLSNQDKPNWSKLHAKILDELGLIPAAVFGIIESYANMDHSVCHAKQGTIAERLDISRASVHKAIQKLCETGYIEDTTPDMRNRAHSLKILWSV